MHPLNVKGLSQFSVNGLLGSRMIHNPFFLDEGIATVWILEIEVALNAMTRLESINEMATTIKLGEGYPSNHAHSWNREESEEIKGMRNSESNLIRQLISVLTVGDTNRFSRAAS